MNNLWGTNISFIGGGSGTVAGSRKEATRKVAVEPIPPEASGKEACFCLFYVSKIYMFEEKNNHS